MKINAFILFLTFPLLFSCKKDQTPHPIVAIKVKNTVELFQYMTGNYWGYQVDYLSEDSIYSSSATTDSVVVVGDCSIRGDQYRIVQTYENSQLDRIEYYRDSSGFLINDHGEIIFSSTTQNTPFNNYSITENNQTLSYYDIISSDIKQISVPAGTFKVYSKERIIDYQNSSDRIIRTQVTSYSEGVGLIYSQKFFISSKYSNFYWLLIRYKV